MFLSLLIRRGVLSERRRGWEGVAHLRVPEAPALCRGLVQLRQKLKPSQSLLT
jgi:hypothetical protein